MRWSHSANRCCSCATEHRNSCEHAKGVFHQTEIVCRMIPDFRAITYNAPRGGQCYSQGNRGKTLKTDCAPLLTHGCQWSCPGQISVSSGRAKFPSALQAKAGVLKSFPWTRKTASPTTACRAAWPSSQPHTLLHRCDPVSGAVLFSKSQLQSRPSCTALLGPLIIVCSRMSG